MSEPLYAPRTPIFPRQISGAFRTAKWWILAVSLGIYLLTPWLRWDRGPNLPDQAVLIDIAGRRFFLFGIQIWPHEFYFVAGLLIMAGLGLFLFTSAAGRVWCGYACPQTVWTDLFLLVERRIEGDRNAQIRLHRQAWTAEKVWKRLLKWSVWAAISLLTGGAWVFYFADAPTLLNGLVTLTAHPVAWITIFVLTATTFVFAGFMREQICIYACPWPRIQAALMDEETITVAYRDWRGEPRGKRSETGRGDCIDCMACVNVCPMGIDIREGQQMACITCGLCIDACDDTMDRIGRPRGLIGYLALSDEHLERAGDTPKPAWRRLFRLRTSLYAVLWAGVGVTLIAALLLRPAVDLAVTPVRNPLFVTLSDGSIRNAYELRLRNMSGEDRRFRLAVDGSAGLRPSIEGSAGLDVPVAANATGLVRLYLTAPQGSDPATGALTDLRIRLDDAGGPEGGPVAAVKAAFHGARS
ncbi:cytochrome c oxidase accessory protein CcoG [Rhodobacter sphaeroides]|uniref:Protein RdxA n=1 Tax=Cereibacter sphaeroides (strain ATCC 17023 / DSM 158 / JCM 6121 / CCUG 31486 / LMG 2827 / NBRC 12203 / NCIMB 8253 / ATH 2.4.1.) TaxID=272943 RepID=RDXA_CERS4|nr:cytochrome c oxidase accessory protein CcoG [Cereibacter sphaeroides]Q01854.1 RecName: Full=Protein RdxA [Cereibacter sphaeroides 2.4.1]AAA26117.1 52 kDa protein [Cereibacter sphaeroides]ABA80642.1 RdxA, iron-sulfur cluster-binding protein [Cereibacter sphaeroides 2.4.1]AMJ48972.1 cytochrome c oxidase accessory protein CcoG [Cereibacter sphaeroides]ANS35688.1 cytochrome c oxidase accessory protein CcoG [Cereibacter sphaeroides]ATN64741.1 cytochrome c oxidase accessory protein CcoG [Cereiba